MNEMNLRHKCPKCTVESTYDPKEFHGLCPSCWGNINPREKARLAGGEIFGCYGDKCNNWTSGKGFDDHGYCKSCWLNLTPEQRAILNGQEPPPTVETKVVTVSLPAVPSLWRVVAAACLGTLMGLSVLGGVAYWMFVR